VHIGRDTAVAVWVIVVTGDRATERLEWAEGRRLGVIPVVAVGTGATCPQPTNKVATKSIPTISKICLVEFTMDNISKLLSPCRLA
jgi:hypothetical protein